MCVSLKLKIKATPEQIQTALQNYSSEAQTLNLPSAPKVAIQVLTEKDRPQPRLDREIGKGYTVSVGRVRPGATDTSLCSFDIRFVLLVHNTVLGAAGGALINAEMAKAKGPAMVKIFKEHILQELERSGGNTQPSIKN